MANLIKITLLSLGLFFILSAVVSAQEPAETTSEVTEAINLDEDVQPQDLGVGDPKLLSDSPFYFFKNWGRGIQSFFTFNPVKKAELRMKFTNEKLMELKKLANKNPEALPEALENYKAEIGRLEEAVGKIEVGAIGKEAEKFIDKFIDNNLKHQKLFGKLEKDLPAEMYEKLEETKKENLIKFSDIGLKLASPEALQEKIVTATENQPGSDFKQFKNLEVLQAIKEKVPDSAKPAIQQAIENSLKRLKGDLEKMSPEDTAQFKDYVENIGGNETRHLAVMDEFEREELPRILREEIDKAKIKILERIETRLKEYGEKNLETAKKEYVSHLTEQGQLEDLRIVKEIENNVSLDVAAQISDTKREVTQKIVQTLEAAETPEQQKEFFENIENKYYDTQQLEVFKEIGELIPPEKKELYEKLKEKAIAKMTEEIEKARKMNTEEKGIIIDKLAGNTPEHIKVLEETLTKPVTPEIIKTTTENVMQKAESIEDSARMEILKQKMAEKEIKTAVEPLKLNITRQLEEKSETLTGQLDRDRVANQMGVAKNTIEICGRTTDPLQPELRDYIRNNPPYKTLMDGAFKHLQEAEKALAENNFGEAFGQAALSSQQASDACKAVTNVITKKISEDDRINKWKEFIKRLYEVAPEVFPYGYDEKTIPSITILINCSFPDISIAKACKEGGGKVKLSADPNRCPYFECGGAVKELPCAGEGEKVNRDSNLGPTNQQCCQGLNEIGISKSYSICKRETYGSECKADTDCPQPLCQGLSSKCIDGKCLMPMCAQVVPPVKPTESTTPIGECPPGEERYYKCPDGAPVLWCKCAAGKWDCISSPENTCPVKKTIKEIRYYKCPDGTQVKWCECFEGGCACLMSPENSCAVVNQPPVTPGEACQTLKEMKYYQCVSGTQVSWCMCAPEGSFAGALNKWQCQRFPENSCPKPIVTPTPTPEMIGCCLSDGVCQYETKEHCLLKNGRVVSSCSVEQCPIPIPIPTPPSYYVSCKEGGMKEHRCSDGTMINWRCICLNAQPSATAYSLWTCELEPRKFCPAPIDSAQLALARMEIRHYFSSIQFFWETSKPTISYMEYGPTTSYGSKAGGLTGAGGSLDTPGTQFVVEGQHLSIGLGDSAKLQPYTTYHFRIIATDTNGDKLVSDDYTFNTFPECLSGTTRKHMCPDITYVDWCKCTAEGKWDCLSSPESTCPVAPAPTATECKLGEIKQYKCSDGVMVDYCKCTSEGKWDCLTSPEKSCPVSTIVPAADTTSPLISGLAARDIMSSTAKIEWETDEPSTSQLIFGITDIYHTNSELKTAFDSSLVTYHSVPLLNLQANTLYYYRVESKDAAGNLTVSGSYTFTTAEGPAGFKFIENQSAWVFAGIPQIIEWMKELMGR